VKPQRALPTSYLKMVSHKDAQANQTLLVIDSLSNGNQHWRQSEVTDAG